MKAALSSSRRGVLLLVILALLAMFALVAVAFVMLTGQERRSAKIIQRIDQQADPPRQVLRQALMEVLRGSNSPQSVMGAHNMLEDIYGNEWYSPWLPASSAASPAVTTLINGQLVLFPVPYDLPDPSNPPNATTNPPPPPRHTACVLTMLNGTASGQSTHIVGLGADPAPGPNMGQISRTVRERDATNTLRYRVYYFYQARAFDNGAQPVAGDAYVINGVPFSGTGFGYEPRGYDYDPITRLPLPPNRTFRLNAKVNGNSADTLLIPNIGSPDGDPWNVSPWTSGPPPAPNPIAPWEVALLPNSWLNRNPLGGANSDYTAVDFQHMLLATPPMQQMQVLVPRRPTDPPVYVPGANNIPSLHRPELVYHWLYRMNSGSIPSTWQRPMWTQPISNSVWCGSSTIMRNFDLLRRIMLRPLPIDHPDFSGSNPAFNPILGPWDIDNDGDGVPDSLWVDLGLPVRSTADGHLYKPLCAILCLDLDGRLNLNAHGMLAQTGDPATDPYYTGVNPSSDELPAPFRSSILAGGPTTPLPLPRGQGYGPPEINLMPLFLLPSGSYSYANYFALLTGDRTLGLEGRYGEFGLLTPPPSNPAPGRTTTSSTTTFPSDPLGWNKWYDYSNDYWNTPPGPGRYGSPPDPQGYGAVGLDMTGQPLFFSMGGSAVSINTTSQNSPYSLNLSRNVARGLNTPSGAAGRTPSGAADNPFGPAELERLLRPFDRDANTLPNRLAALTTPPTSSTSLLKDKRHAITTESWDLPCPPPAVPSAVLQASSLPEKRARHVTDLLVARGVNPMHWVHLLPPELLAGVRMNLNRPVADLSTSYLYTRPGNTLPTGNMSYDEYGTAGFDSIKARQRLARYLFVLMLLLQDNPPSGVRFDAGYFTEATLTPDERQALTIRRIAQWAINVACFQSGDSVMVPFDYDPDPFNPNTTAGTAKTDPDDETATTWMPPTPPATFARPIYQVWGCTPPELLITEVTAFHDRRVADTPVGGTRAGTPADPDLDQTRIPQGSFFAELYCPRSRVNSAAPSDLYTGGSLDLERLAPQSPTPGVLQYPVWRMVITGSRIASANNDVLTRLTTYPDSSSLEPEQCYPGETDDGKFSLLPTPPPPTMTNVRVERIIWFSATAPSARHIGYDRIYYKHGGPDGQLPRGQYAVVGPRPVTHIGSASPLGTASPHVINLLSTTGTSNVNVVPNSGTSTYPAYTTPTNPATDAIQAPLGIVVAGQAPPIWPAGSPAATNGIGISISEPLWSAGNYYQEPTITVNGVTEWYGTPPDGAPGAFLNTPLDDDAARPLATDGLLPTATTQPTTNYKTVFLQRLANPSLAYQPDPAQANYNPYRTVDWMPIDLTVFNGEDHMPTSWTGPGAWDPNDLTTNPGPPPPTPTFYFATRQRGTPAPGTLGFNLWAQVTNWPPTTPSTPTPGLNFPYNLHHTLGYINETFSDVTRPPGWIGCNGRTPPTTPSGGSIGSEYYGDPWQPFPWLTWNNRPFVCPQELLLVPSSHPARLLWEYRFASGTSPTPYDLPPDPRTPDSIGYPHLLNFFLSPLPPTPPATAPTSPLLHRLLEYVCVPSRFVGTEVQANPTIAAAAGNHPFHPPFNRIPLMREPGRMNLNTIFDPDVLIGLTYGSVVDWRKFFLSRRGYGIPEDSMLKVDPTFPTCFVRPFRSFGGGEKVPLTTGPSSMVPQREIEATLLRPDPVAAAQPLLMSPTSTNAYNDTNRNPYFRYQALQRLGNLVTTRSNVFAIWITVGYFEVRPWTQADGNAGVPQPPDGYLLGQELGSDTGEIERHRAFFMIDRTIPVGFQRGQDLNVENVLLLQRYIE